MRLKELPVDLYARLYDQGVPEDVDITFEDETRDRDGIVVYADGKFVEVIPASSGDFDIAMRFIPTKVGQRKVFYKVLDTEKNLKHHLDLVGRDLDYKPPGVDVKPVLSVPEEMTWDKIDKLIDRAIVETQIEEEDMEQWGYGPIDEL
jgi:hypothetical protein